MNAATPSFAEWRQALKSHGFRGLGTGGRKGTYLGREIAPFQQAIGVLVNEGRGGAFCVQLNINMSLRCAEPAHQVVLLDGDLGPAGIRIREPWVHDPGGTTWWAPDQVEAAWTALQDHGLGWLEEYASVPRLIKFFESGHARHESEGERPDRGTLAGFIARKLGLSRPRAPTAHFQYLLWLSMLYEEEGKLDLARERLEAYAAEVLERGLAGERERLERHRAALKELATKAGRSRSPGE